MHENKPAGETQLAMNAFAGKFFLIWRQPATRKYLFLFKSHGSLQGETAGATCLVMFGPFCVTRKQFEIQLIRKISEKKLQSFEFILTPLSTR